MTQNSRKTSKPFWRFRLGRESVERPPSNGEGFRNITIARARYETREFIFDSLWHFILICDRYYYKMRQKFITKCVRFLWQNATVLLQNATVVTNCDDFITKFDVYYKLRQYIQEWKELLKWNKKHFSSV